MKTGTNNGAKSKLHEVKHERSRMRMNDPTLEGKDENKVGRVQRKIDRAEKAAEK